MDPLTAGAIAAPVIGGLLGSSSAKKQAQQAAALRAQALAQFAGIDLPTMEQQLYNFETPDYIGDLVAAQEQAVDIGPSAMEGVSVDPRLKLEQMKALEAISQRAEQGFSPEDMMAFQQARRGAAAEAQAKQQQVLQEMQARGLGGAGTELASRLMASQRGADRLSAESMQLAQQQAEARKASEQALAQLSSGMRSQEFGEQSDVARARDVLNQFRAQNLQGVRARNIAAQQQAAARNIGEQQRLSDVSAQTRNLMEQRRGDLPGQQFGQQMQLAGAKAGALTGGASAADAEAARRAQMGATIGAGVGNIFASFVNDENK